MPAKNHVDFHSETRFALLEQTIEHIYEALNRIDKRFDKIDERFDKLDSRLDKMDNKIDRNFYVLLTIYLGGYAGLFAIMAKGFHWF